MPIMQEIIDANDNGQYELGFYQYLPSFRNSVKPAVNVYEDYKYTLKDVQLPQEAIKYLN